MENIDKFLSAFEHNLLGQLKDLGAEINKEEKNGYEITTIKVKLPNEYDQLEYYIRSASKKYFLSEFEVYNSLKVLKTINMSVCWKTLEGLVKEFNYDVDTIKDSKSINLLIDKLIKQIG